MANYNNIIILLTFVALLAGCATVRQNVPSNSTVVTATTQEYLQQAAKSQGAKKQQYQMLAAKQLLTDQNLHDAQQLLQQIKDVKTDTLIYANKMILQAQLALLNNKPKLAVRELHKVRDPKSLPHDVAITYYTTVADAHLRSDNLAYNTVALISLNSLLTDKQLQQQHRITIWHNLQTLPLSNLQKLLQRCTANLLRGWIQLAIIVRENANNPMNLYTAMEKWQQDYPQHPANNVLPDANTLASLLQVKIPAKIALFLPLHGKFATMGRAVRDGYMTAYYANIKKLPVVPQIKVYDTSRGDITNLYRQAVQDGIQFIVGPLTKEKVKDLAEIGNLTIPTLTLNYLPDNTALHRNVVQFGLLPEYAAQQTAEAMWRHGINNVLIIVPQGEWGDKIRQAFLSQWQQFNGYVAGTITFSASEKISDEIATAFNVKQSELRAQQLQMMLGKKLKFIARRRQDINGIFLVALPAQARQINPLLQFYYAGDLPVFSISNIYAGKASSNIDRDLNWIRFNDMPWILRNTGYIGKLQQQIKKLWPINFRTENKLYGLGIDAYTLTVLLPRLQILPNFAINGVTGQLYLTQQQRIYRQLSWARFVAGVVKEV
jgi:outer membrane PBP1 activator LpoA protein